MMNFFYGYGQRDGEGKTRVVSDTRRLLCLICNADLDGKDATKSMRQHLLNVHPIFVPFEHWNASAAKNVEDLYNQASLNALNGKVAAPVCDSRGGRFNGAMDKYVVNGFTLIQTYRLSTLRAEFKSDTFSYWKKRYGCSRGIVIISAAHLIDIPSTVVCLT